VVEDVVLVGILSNPSVMLTGTRCALTSANCVEMVSTSVVLETPHVLP
jgi:hypothetical protein